MTPEARQRRRVRAPVLAVTAGAWMVMLAVGLRHAGSSGHEPAGPTSLPPAAGSLHQHADALVVHSGPGTSALATAVGWTAMLLAMMAPLLIPALRHVVDRSLPRRRGRATTLLIAGYAATWAIAWAVLAGASTLIRSILVEPRAALALGLLVAVAWQVSPAKQRCLNRCHARPALAPFGAAADLDVLRYGQRQAGWCVGSCWALMLVPVLVPTHHLGAMALVSLWMWAERFDRPQRPVWRLRWPATSAHIVVARGRALSRPALAR